LATRPLCQPVRLVGGHVSARRAERHASTGDGYPEAETSAITLKLENPVRLAIHFRVPRVVCEAMSLAVNGSPIDVPAKPSRWAPMGREWKSGDTVAITIPVAPGTVPVDRQHPDLAAIMYGPVVLAQGDAYGRRQFSIAPTTEPVITRLIRRREPALPHDQYRARAAHTLSPATLFGVRILAYWIYFDLASPALY
jgi:hypothetical protein